MKRGWSDLQERWGRSCPPLRVHPEAVDAYRSVLPETPVRTLLLGVTRELASLVTPLVAVDWNEGMIGAIWPGDAPGRIAVQADWRDMPFAPASFDVAIGDGALNMIRWPGDQACVAERLRQTVRPDGTIALRCFSPPPELAFPDLSSVAEMDFHAFKLRLMMASARANGGPNIAMRAVFERFEALFPDRDALSAATGWPLSTIAEIDDYAVSPLVMSFPTQAELLELFPGARFVATGSYQGAEHCPLLVCHV